MINKVCQNCQSIVELDETAYQPGESVSIECQLCGETVVFTIPDKKPEKAPEKKAPEKKAPEKAPEKSQAESPIPKSEKPQAANEAKPATVRVTDANVRRRVPDNTKTNGVNRVTQGQKQHVGDTVNNNTYVAPTNHTAPYSSNTSRNHQIEIEDTEDGKGSNKKLIGCITVLLLIVGGIFGMWYYNSVYLPEKIDRESPRYFTLASSLVLRSSKEKDVEYNKVTSLPYGTKLIVYDIDGQWAKVKVDNSSGKQEQGFVSADFILDPKDFKILNSIYGNAEAREIIESGRTKKALLNYFKDNRFIGSLTSDDLSEVGLDIEPSNGNQWQVFCDKSGSKLNTVKFQRLVNPGSKHQDMGIIIENIVTGDRRLLYFYFDDIDETPHLYGEMNIPRSGKLRSFVTRGGDIYPQFE